MLKMGLLGLLKTEITTPSGVTFNSKASRLVWIVGSYTGNFSNSFLTFLAWMKSKFFGPLPSSALVTTLLAWRDELGKSPSWAGSNDFLTEDGRNQFEMASSSLGEEVAISHKHINKAIIAVVKSAYATFHEPPPPAISKT